jgi:Na+-driven multidrug efflux pump
LTGVRADLRIGPLLRVWAPLAVTFLLVTGSTPIINASINRLPGIDQEADLAAFAVFLACLIFLHSPLFVTREIAIKLSVDRAGAGRALRFCLAAAAVVSGVEVVLALTPLGRWFLDAFTDRADVIAAAQPAFLWLTPAPFFIAARGVYQAHQIRVDDTLFVGLGTIVRLGCTAVLGFWLAPRVSLNGPRLGALCISVGLGVETIFAAARARIAARPPDHSDEPTMRVLAFGLPLMFANFLGVGASLFYVRIAALVPEAWEKSSLAGFQEVKTLHFLLGSAAMAMQSLTTAKVRARRDFAPMLRFTVLVGAVLSCLLGLIAFTPLRDYILVDLMNEKPDGDVLRFATTGLALAVVMPLLGGVRFCMRGLLISQGRTRVITLGNICVLLFLGVVTAFRLVPSATNGAFNAYAAWVAALLVELMIFRAFARRDRVG